MVLFERESSRFGRVGEFDTFDFDGCTVFSVQNNSIAATSFICLSSDLLRLPRSEIEMCLEKYVRRRIMFIPLLCPSVIAHRFFALPCSQIGFIYQSRPM